MYKCRKCGRKFETPMAIGGHSIYCGKIRKITCSICGRSIDKWVFNKHMSSHAKDRKCKTCGKVIYGFTGKQFCNRSCAAVLNNGKYKKRKPLKINTCARCGIVIKNDRKFCSSKCRRSYKYKKYIKRWLSGKANGNKGEQVAVHVRTWVFRRAGSKCEGILDDGTCCGWARKNKFTNKIPLTVHHKDGDYKNTVPNNLELLCPNCHSLTKTYGGLNKGKGREGRQKWRMRKRASIV